MTASSGLIRLIAAAARVTAGLKWPPLTTPNMTISPNSRKAWTSPTTAKSEPNCAWLPVDTNSTTTLVMKNTSKSVPINSARYAARPRSCTLSSSSRDPCQRPAVYPHSAEWNRLPRG